MKFVMRQALHFTRKYQRKISYCIIFLLSIFYLGYITQIPLTILGHFGHDDGLFIKLGASIANGQWLGPFNNLTLAKGPGYPLFLALAHFSGFSIQFCVGILFLFSLLALTFAIDSLTKSTYFALLSFAVLLFHPSVVYSRLLRESIYHSEVLLGVSFLILSLYCLKNTFLKTGSALISGLFFGWFWITREEGISFLPFLGILFLFEIWRLRRASIRWTKIALSTLVPFLCMLLTFSVVISVIKAINNKHYGASVVVDIKESNFIETLKLLQKIKYGPRITYVPVSSKMREAAYRASPAFSRLREFFDPPGSVCKWARIGGKKEIIGGFFMWALRDAAAMDGGYQSPRRSIKLYKKINKELRHAFKSGKLQTDDPFLLAYLPPIDQSQWERLPSELLSALEYLSLLNLRHRTFSFSMTNERYLEFLNYPRHTPDKNIHQERVISGWYYLKGMEWFSVTTFCHPNKYASLERLPSPDIGKHFNDSKAMLQRFRITTNAANNEIAFIINKSTNPLYFNLKPHTRHEYNDACWVIDSIKYVTNKEITPKPFNDFLNLFTDIYKICIPIILSAGLISALFLLIFKRNRYVDSPVLHIALFLLAVTLGRVLLLSLISISAFQAVLPTYLNFAYLSITLSALLFSFEVGSWIKNRKNN